MKFHFESHHYAGPAREYNLHLFCPALIRVYFACAFVVEITLGRTVVCSAKSHTLRMCIYMYNTRRLASSALILARLYIRKSARDARVGYKKITLEPQAISVYERHTSSCVYMCINNERVDALSE